MLAPFVPIGVVTKMLAVPAVPDGAVQVMLVALTTVTPEQALPPTVTPVAPVKFVPVIVIDVPPAELPEVGDTDVTVGTGPIVNVTVCDPGNVQT